MGNGFNEWGIGVIEVTKEYLRTSVDGFCIANAMKHKFDEDLGSFPMVDHHEKIVELRREHLLETVQNHVVERFDQKLDCQMVWIDDVRFAACYFRWEI